MSLLLSSKRVVFESSLFKYAKNPKRPSLNLSKESIITFEIYKEKIKNSKITIKNEWNDGIYVRVADFDKNDKFIDVYVTETGTDIGAYTTIYRYDGQKLYKYKGFSHYLSDFLYDGKGNIYFDDSEAAEGILGSYKTKFNYKTGKIEGKK